MRSAIPMPIPNRPAIVLAGLLTAVLLSSCSTSEPEPIVSALHFFQRGNQAFSDENYAGAIQNYKKAIALEADVADFHFNLGVAYYQAAAYEEAVDAFSQALTLKSDFADAHLNMALAYDRLYNRQAAHQHFRRYQELTVAATGPKAPAAAAALKEVRKREVAATDRVPPAPPPGRKRVRPAPARTDPAAPQTSGDQTKWWIQDRFIPNP